MNTITIKKAFAAAFTTLLVFFSFVGCSSSASSTNATDVSSSAESLTQGSNGDKVSEPVEIAIGEVVSVEDDNGAWEISIEGADGSSDWNEKAEGDYEDGQRIVLLKLNVENKSYESDDGEIRLTKLVDFVDSDGFSIEPMSTGWDYGQYSVAVGGWIEIDKGQKKRIAIPYLVSETSDVVTVVVDGFYKCTLAIEVDDEDGNAAEENAEVEESSVSEEKTKNDSASDDSASENDSSTKESETSASVVAMTSDVAAYCEKMQDCFNRLVEAMDAAHDAEASGDVEAATKAREQSDDVYYDEVLTSTAPVEAQSIDYRMRQFAASSNLLVMYYEDAAIAKAEGDSQRYNEDMAEIKTVINEVSSDSANLSKAINDLSKKHE